MTQNDEATHKRRRLRHERERAEEEKVPQIRMIAIDRISPDSEINSRRHGVDENAKRLQASIETHGFRPEHPVLLRPFTGSRTNTIGSRCQTGAA